ncbi:MAG TPA: GAF domain-containing SpoIIE family protein phosphatase, partial [Blastocatellia bacterium]|nr:GAF domain-containing SpoIIE family protein phosphatase [Blastocatellia bacterium]
MRVFPLIRVPKARAFARRLRKLRRDLLFGRALLVVEFLVFAVALLVLLYRSRDFAEWVEEHPFVATLILVTATFVLLHLALARRVRSVIERRFAPPPYDERRILFDLGQEARAATNIDELYNSIVFRIAAALQSSNVSVFVRDDVTGDFFCRALWPEPASDPLEKEQLVLSRNFFVVRRLRHLASPLIVEPEELDIWGQALSLAPPALRQSRLRERELLQRVKAYLMIQIRIKDQLIGILSLGPRRAPHKYSQADKDMLISVAGEMAFVIENSRLAERMVAEERLRRELVLATQVQQRLFPTHPPVSTGAELSGFCQPARGVGGDYYDFLSLDHGRIGIAVADVAGKGISAALLMSSVQASLRSQAMIQDGSPETGGSLVTLVSNLNRLLFRSTGGTTYVTFFYAQLDVKTRQLTYVNAGHNPPLLLRSKERAGAPPVSACSSLTTGGTIIGMFDQCHYEEETIQLRAGDLLIAYTDGVTEALNAYGEEFGEERLLDALREAGDLSAEETRDFVVKRVAEWCGS